jgi:hypothetical protein
MKRLTTRCPSGHRLAQIDGWLAEWQQRSAYYVVLRPDGGAEAFSLGLLEAALSFYEAVAGSRLLELRPDNIPGIRLWAITVSVNLQEPRSTS